MKLYVGNLGDDGVITSADLRPLFEQFGNVSECECIKNYAFVHMDEDSAAHSALTALSGRNIKGRIIKVEKSESKGKKRPSQKIFVGNLPEGTTNDELRTLFEPYCEVLESDVIKNFGFVHIDAETGRPKMGQILRDLNGFDMRGSQIRVQPSTSGVRQKPGMGGGDQCYRCGHDGHWSKECPRFTDSNPRGMRFGNFGPREPPYPHYPPNYGRYEGMGSRRPAYDDRYDSYGGPQNYNHPGYNTGNSGDSYGAGRGQYNSWGNYNGYGE